MAAFKDRLRALRRRRSLRLIARSGVFDEAWYGAQNPDCAETGLAPGLHYLLVGAARGARPHLLFDPDWFARGRRGARRRAANPLLDYLRFGAALDPSPYFDAAHYRALAGDLEGLTPLGHFIRFGLARGLSPAPFFDRAWYLAAYPDVKAAGLDPFLHFVASGAREGRSPSPLFDAPWFLAREPTLRESGLEPLPAFLAYGAPAGARPQEGFDPTFYAGAADVPLGAAFSHYAREGRAGWRSAHRILPPPGSPAASFQDLPWRRAGAPRPAAPFRVMIVAPAGAPAARALRKALAAWTALDVHVLARGASAEPEGFEAALDLAGLARAGLPEEIALDRAARALKFHDPEAVVVSSGAPGPALSRACRETGLALLTLEAGAGEAAAARCAGLLRWALAYRETPRRSVSVAVPNYNHARFLDERLGSIMAQTLAPDEILFLDDASDDDSLAVAKRWRDRSAIPFVILSSAQNGGSPFRQWAKGVRAARGDLVWIAESDDAAEPRFLETMTACFARPGLALAYCDSKTIGPGGDLLASSARFYTDTLDAEKWLVGHRAPGAQETAQALVVKNTIPNVSAALFSRAALTLALREIESCRYCGDWAAYVEALRYGDLAYRPQALNRRRQDRESVTGQGERGLEAVREALAVKRSIFARLRVDDARLAQSFAQSAFEYERRSLAPGGRRPGFAANPGLQGEFDALGASIARLGPALDACGAATLRFLEGLGAHDAGLTRAQGRALAATAFGELRALAGRL
ncbi:glycosyltransferase family 2 protein [Methylocella sp.]|uniref:glycosyltransferase family 2 protein n=1 Tax=Methylocella sp. TaxID=1978226 RepID=UPI00378356A7